MEEKKRGEKKGKIRKYGTCVKDKKRIKKGGKKEKKKKKEILSQYFHNKF